jgi:hypothetical protein
VKRIDIRVNSIRKSVHGVNLEYNVIKSADQKIDLNSGITFGDLEKLDRLLKNANIKFEVENIIQDSYIERLSVTNRNVLFNHRGK